MAPFKKLQINLLSNSGELLNCVSCFAGQVSVFRALSSGALEPYQRALLGMPGPEKFSIILDGQTYVPHEHNLIGFGEQFVPQENSVGEYLINLGVPEGALDSLLVSFGLEMVCNSRFSALTRCEERRVRLVAATYVQNRILIVNNPFEPISSQWRERFAELLVTFARSKSQIVVVTALSNRPECWIDNEFIARIQVGETVQKTIGFGTNSTSINMLVNQVREQLKNDPSMSGAFNIPNQEQSGHAAAQPQQVQQQGQHPTAQHYSGAVQRPAAHAMPQQQAPRQRAASAAWTPAAAAVEDLVEDESPEFEEAVSPRRRRQFASIEASPLLQLYRRHQVTIKKLGAVGGGVFAALLLGMMFFRGEAPLDPQQVAVNVPQHEAAAPSSNAPPSRPAEPSAGEVKPDVVPVEVKIEPPVRPRQPDRPAEAVENPDQPHLEHAGFVLDDYSPAIRKSILETFEGNAPILKGGSDQSALMGDRDGSSEGIQIKNKETGDLLKLLQSASDKDPAPSAGGYAPPPSMNAPPAYYNPPVVENNAAPAPSGSEEEKREQIRKKFLEAIEKAAEKRRQSVDF